jgi:hypothetical protein
MKALGKGGHKAAFCSKGRCTKGQCSRSVIPESTDCFFFAPLAFPAFLVFGGSQGYWLPASFELSPKNIVRTEGVPAVQGEAVVQNVQNL